MTQPPLNPKRPERICWGCDKYCPVNDMACGNGKVRTPHPIEILGDDWLAGIEREAQSGAGTPSS